MVLNTYVNYFEHWKITTSNYAFFALVDLWQRRQYTFQGDEAAPLEQKYEEVGPLEFVEWFYSNEYYLSVDHANYELSGDDKVQLALFPVGGK